VHGPEDNVGTGYGDRKVVLEYPLQKFARHSERLMETNVVAVSTLEDGEDL
jgi:hypothetical protein